MRAQTDIKTGEPHVKEIEKLIDQLNDAWLNDKLENMDMFFNKQAVMIEPGTNRRITGREKIIDSYREFAETSDVTDFRIKDLMIDLFETTAVALYTYRIKYRVETTQYDESGTEILVFHCHNDHWRIMWRTQQP